MAAFRGPLFGETAAAGALNGVVTFVVALLFEQKFYVLFSFLFGYGLGLYGEVGAAAGFAISLAIFASQIPLSAWWLARFRFGPAEWLLRSFTYLRVQPLRAQPKEATR